MAGTWGAICRERLMPGAPRYNSSATGIADRPRGQGWIGRPGQPHKLQSRITSKQVGCPVLAFQLPSRNIKENG